VAGLLGGRGPPGRRGGGGGRPVAPGGRGGPPGRSGRDGPTRPRWARDALVRGLTPHKRRTKWPSAGADGFLAALVRGLTGAQSGCRQAPMASWVARGAVTAWACTTRLCGVRPLTNGAQAGLSAGAGGVSGGARRRDGLGLYGERGVAGNVGRIGPAHGDPDVTGDDRRQRRDRRVGARDSRRYRRWRRACRRHPFPVPSRCRYREPDRSRRPRRRRPTTPARHQRSRSASGYDGNVARTAAPQPDCDVTGVYRRQRRTGRASGRFVRRYRRRRRHHRPGHPPPGVQAPRRRLSTPRSARRSRRARSRPRSSRSPAGRRGCRTDCRGSAGRSGRCRAGRCRPTTRSGRAG
jgi:hypothetical protein